MWLLMLDNFSSFLIFPINRFHPALGTAAPCSLPRVTVEGGNKVLGSEFHLLDLTDIWPHLTSCFLSSYPSSSWASSHLAFEQTEMSSYSAVSSDDHVLLGADGSPSKVCILVFHFHSCFSEIPSNALMFFAVTFLSPGLFLSDAERAWCKYLKCWREKKPLTLISHNKLRNSLGILLYTWFVLPSILP